MTVASRLIFILLTETKLDFVSWINKHGRLRRMIWSRWKDLHILALSRSVDKFTGNCFYWCSRRTSFINDWKIHLLNWNSVSASELTIKKDNILNEHFELNFKSGLYLPDLLYSIETMTRNRDTRCFLWVQLISFGLDTIIAYSWQVGVTDFTFDVKIKGLI